MKKYGFLLLLFLLSVCCAGCSGEPEEVPAPPPETASLGRTIVIDEGGTVYWGFGSYLYTGGLSEGGSIRNHQIKAQVEGTIRSLAVYGEDLFLCTGDGLFRCPLSDLETGSLTLTQLTTDHPSDGFEILRDQLYYEYGGNLWRLSLAGGGPEKSLTDIYTYHITPEGIWYTARAGGLFRQSLDGTERTQITETGVLCHFALTEDTVYFRCEEDNTIWACALADGSVTQVDKQTPLSEISHLWAGEGWLLYETAGLTVCRYDLATGEETLLAQEKRLPDKCEGFLKHGILCVYDSYREELYTIPLTQGRGSD